VQPQFAQMPTLAASDSSKPHRKPPLPPVLRTPAAVQPLSKARNSQPVDDSARRQIPPEKIIHPDRHLTAAEPGRAAFASCRRDLFATASQNSSFLIRT